MHKKAPILLLILFISPLLYAGDTAQVKKFRRFYGGVSVTPGVSYRYLSHNYSITTTPSHPGFNNGDVEKMIIDTRTKYEKPSFGYSCGIKVGVKVTSYFSIETGLEYNSQATRTQRKDLVFNSDFHPDLTYDTANMGSLTADNGFHYINIPLAFNFSIGKKKVKALISTGVNFNVLIGQWSNVKWQSLSEGKHEQYNSTSNIWEFKRFNLSPFLGVGIDYQINDLMTLQIMPIAQMQALKNIDTPITEHLWSAGVNCSLLFSFKKIKS